VKINYQCIIAEKIKKIDLNVKHLNWIRI